MRYPEALTSGNGKAGNVTAGLASSAGAISGAAPPVLARMDYQAILLPS